MARECLLALPDTVAAGSFKPAELAVIAWHERIELEPPP
jgi:hypothetical protein